MEFSFNSFGGGGGVLIDFPAECDEILREDGKTVYPDGCLGRGVPAYSEGFCPEFGGAEGEVIRNLCGWEGKFFSQNNEATFCYSLEAFLYTEEDSGVNELFAAIHEPRFERITRHNSGDPRLRVAEGFCEFCLTHPRLLYDKVYHRIMGIPETKGLLHAHLFGGGICVVPVFDGCGLVHEVHNIRNGKGSQAVHR